MLLGGLSEGAWLVDDAQESHLTAGLCLPGDDVTGFAEWGEQLVVATRSGMWSVPESCLQVL